ncbi:hypothetical protein GF386_02225 [Candidatus Pacearchaeota archaeon]|nr:hypothetical protein [Candidatus Pacearchaeota archaeon]
MKFKISEKISEKYLELEISVITARNLDNSKNNEEIQKKIRVVVEKIRSEIDSDKVAELPVIAKWREIYKSFGAKPGKYRNSAEALIKRVLKKDLYKINLLVDIYNYISIKYKMTVGGEDIDKLEGDLILDFADGNENFIPLGESENDYPWKGEVVYKDDREVFCRCWNWREGDRTKLTEDTKNALIVIENPAQIYDKVLCQAEDDLIKLLEDYCNAECKVWKLNNERREIEI